MACRHQAIIRTSAGLLSIWHLGANFNDFFSQTTKLSTHKNEYENIVCEKAAILSNGRAVKNTQWYE